MSLDAISTVAAESMGSLATPASTGTVDLRFGELGAPATEASSFDSVMTGLEALNDRLVAGNSAVQALALGQTDNLHQVMIAGEQTRMAFDLMLQVRSKLLDAYQELLRMQV